MKSSGNFPAINFVKDKRNILKLEQISGKRLIWDIPATTDLPANCAVACISLDLSFRVNSSYALLVKPASVYSDEVHHSVSIAAELVSEYGIHGVAVSGFSKLQHSWTCFCM